MKQTYSQAYLEFLVHYHASRDYFECHEVLEEHWKAHPDSPYSVTWVGLIQAAVGMYHYRRGNWAGAEKTIIGSLSRFREQDLLELGIDAQAWRKKLESVLDQIRKRAPFRDIEIPIADEALLSACRELARQLGVVWGAPSDMADEELIHRHLRRDRTEITEERKRQLAKRRADRSE